MWGYCWESHPVEKPSGPPLALTPADRCQCFGPTLRWVTPGEGAGKVCLDDHGRATIEFENVPKAAVGTAMTEC